MRTKPATEGRKLLQVWMPPELIAKLRAAATSDGLTVALYVRRLLTRKFFWLT